MSTQDNQVLQNARAIVDANAKLLELFAAQYMLDNGIGIQMAEAIARELFGQQVEVNGMVHENVGVAPTEMLKVAVNDVVDVTVSFGGTRVDFTIDGLIGGAASLELLVRYARKLDPRVMPAEVIPSDEVVSAALVLFHAEFTESADDESTE